MVHLGSRRSFAGLVAALVVAVGCTSDDAGSKPSTSTAAQAQTEGPTSAIDERLAQLAGAGVFVGGVAMTGSLVAVHFGRADPRAMGMRVLVTDGLPDGNAEWFEGRANGARFSFTSASGKAKIDGTIEEFETDGTVTLADGVTRNFFTRPAGDGAGIFEITVAAGGSWTGKSLDGSTFTARQTGNIVEGSVVSTKGEKYDFKHNDLTRRLGYRTTGGAPDSYTTVVTRQATEIQGRGGDVKGGRPSANIVALDLDQSEKATPGVFHGRVSMVTDRLNFEIVPQPDGSRLVRSYISDSEPDPAGDLQWFAEKVTGNQFSITSKMQDKATMTGTIADDGVSGELTLPDGVARRYFAAPSGEGAGIYTVTVAQDRRHTGTSEQGAKLDLKFQDGTVMGTLTSPDGKAFPMLGADLAHAYRYDDEYSKPDTYTAFVAPRGRYVFGRSGPVRTGSGGLNIIGLDKKC